MIFKDFIYTLDPKLGPTLVVKPFWEIAKSEVSGIVNVEIERGQDPINFIKALERRGNISMVERIKFEPVQTTACCSTITLLGYGANNKLITRVNFNLRNKPKVT